MRPLLPSLLLTAALMTVPADAATSAPVSSLTVQVRVPLRGLGALLDARAPRVIADLNQPGPLGLTLTGQILRSGVPEVVHDGDALLVTLPVTANIRASLGGAAQQDFSGAANVRVRVTPYLREDWSAGVRAQADYTWTDPLAFTVLGARISVAPLVDAQVRAQLGGVTQTLEREVAQRADARSRVQALWTRAARPWALPAPEPAFARIRPLSLSATPFQISDDAASVTVTATFSAEAELGKPPASAPTVPALPPLRIAPTTHGGVTLALPVRLPYPQLSTAMTRYLSARAFRGSGAFSPTVQVTRVDVTPQGARLNAATQVRVSLGPLHVNATVDVSGVPALNSGQTLSLQDVQVHTRPEGLTGRVIGWLADTRVQAFLSQNARADLNAPLGSALESVRSRLPFRPVSGVILSGRVDRLDLNAIQVTPSALVIQTRLSGDLNASIDASGLR